MRNFLVKHDRRVNRKLDTLLDDGLPVLLCNDLIVIIQSPLCLEDLVAQLLKRSAQVTGLDQQPPEKCKVVSTLETNEPFEDVLFLELGIGLSMEKVMRLKLVWNRDQQT